MSVSSYHPLDRTRRSVAHVQGGPKIRTKMAQFLYALTLQNVNRFSKLSHSQNQEKIFVIILPLKIPPHLKCVATLPYEMSVSQLQQLNENKTTSVTTHVKKLTAGNDVFTVSVIV